MTYASQFKILASDYNGFIGNPTGSSGGDNIANTAFANSSEATDAVGALIGVGFGDRGYGQTASFTLPKITIGTTIRSSHWTDLRNAINRILDHTGTAKTNLVPTSVLEIGDVIVAHDGNDNPNDELNSFISTIDTNRLNTDSGASMSTTTSVHTSTRSTTWSSIINTTVTSTFTNANEAGYFFNSGGELRMNLDHPNGTSAQDNDWRSVLQDNVGEIRLGANGTTQSASSPLGTVSTAVGFYDLTGTFQTIYDGTNIGGGAYSANDVLIEARVTGTAANGRPGAVVEIKVTLDDQHVASGGGPDTVASGTNVDFDLFKATVHLSGIESPTWATSEAF